MDKFDRLNAKPPLPPRPRELIRAEQQRHDRAQTRGLVAVFAVLIVGGGLGAFIVLGPLFRGQATVQAVLVALVFLLPLLAALVFMARVPPAPFESITDPDRAIDRKEKERRIVLLSVVFNAGMMALQGFWLWPRRTPVPTSWPFVVAAAAPTLFIVAIGLVALYVRPGWFNPEARALDDELTASFRARAQSLGYLLLLVILAVCVALVRLNPLLAARVMPLGVGLGVILPVLYFVYLDWQASRSG